MTRFHAAAAALVATFVWCSGVHNAGAATFATLDADSFPQNGGNGFRFGDFDDDFFDTFDVSQGVISLDLQNDFDGANGFFGGAGSDMAADFDASTTQIEMRVRIDPLNAASAIRVALTETDDPAGDTGDEHIFEFNLAGEPTDEFITLIQPMTNPGPLFTQTAFGRSPGDGIQNYGLVQMQIQSVFDVADRLKVDIESVKLVDPDAPEDPLLIELTPATFAAQPARFDFGNFQDAGVVDQSGGTFVIDTTLSPNPGDPGGLGFSGLDVDFEAEDFQIEVEAKLLPNNTAPSFNLLMGDNDGDDSGPMLGSDDNIFTVATDQFNTDDFSTVTIPLGTGTEDNIVTSFGFNNGGDGIQNFDLSQLQIQVDAVNTEDGLAVEIRRFSIVRRMTIPGDFDGNGVVDAADFTIWRDNLGGDESVLGGAGDGSGTVDIEDYDLWVANFSRDGDSAVATPEPSSVIVTLVALAGIAALRRGQH